MTATPASNDIVAKRNQIIEIDLVNTLVEGQGDTIVVNSSGGGSTNYVATSTYVSPSSY